MHNNRPNNMHNNSHRISPQFVGLKPMYEPMCEANKEN